jgi:hypothetical protein
MPTHGTLSASQTVFALALAEPLEKIEVGAAATERTLAPCETRAYGPSRVLSALG